MATPAGRSRRRFLSTVGLATTGFTIVPRHVLGRGFQAPSDRLNIAVVGVGGRGRAVITNMVGENLVAMCDVDWGYADQGFADLETDISKLEERIAANVVEVRAPASARNEGAPPAVTTRPMTPLERSRAIGYAGRQRTLDRRGAEGRSLPGLPPDARPAEGHRRGGRGHTRSPARGRRAGRDGPRQARLRREAAVLVGRRGPAAGQARRRDEGGDADGQSGPLDRRWAHGRGVPPGRRPWRGDRGARLDQPSARLLAAGRAAAGGDDDTGRRDALERARHHGAPRRRHGPLPQAGGPGLGSLPRSGAVRRVPPGVSPLQLARLGRLGRRSARRHGRASDRPRRTGASTSACRRRSKPSRRRSTTSRSRTLR